MKLSEAGSTLRQYLKTNWVDGAVQKTPIAWENIDPIDFAGDQKPLEKGQTPWLSVEFFPHSSQTITVPGHCIRYYGTLEFGVFVKDGKGTPGDPFIDDLVDLFENQTLGTVGQRLRVKNIVSTTKYHTTSGWYVHRISFAFQFERFKLNP